MVNIDEFLKRLEVILDYYSLSASVFADKMGVQRSGLSHLMSGRNKPSWDFVMKIIDNFPEVNLYWLLNGEGSFPKKDNEERQTTELSSPTQAKNETQAFDLFSTEKNNDVITNSHFTEKKSETHYPETKMIERIVIFYNDGTFKNYNPEN